MLLETLPKNFPKDKYVATITHGPDSRYGDGPNTFGKIILPAFSNDIESESLNFTIRIVLVYNGFDIRRGDLASSFAFRTLIKGVGTLDNEDPYRLRAAIQGAVNAGVGVGVNALGPVGPAVSFLTKKAEEVTSHLKGIASKSSNNSRILSPISDEILAEVNTTQILYEGAKNIPAEIHKRHSLPDDCITSKGIVAIKSEIDLVGDSVSRLLEYMNSNEIKSGERYGAPRFSFRFKHMPKLDELLMDHGRTRSALMYVDVEHKNKASSSGYLHVPIERGISDRGLFEQSELFSQMNGELDELKKKVSGTEPSIDVQSAMLQMIEIQQKLTGYVSEQIKQNMGKSMRTDF